MDTFYFNRAKIIGWLVFYSLLFVLCLTAAIITIYKRQSNNYHVIVWPFICGSLVFKYGKLLYVAYNNKPALIVSDRSVYVFDTGKTYDWVDIEFFRKREGLTIENIELKLYSNHEIDKLPWLKRKWASVKLHKLFNIGIINASNSYIVNSLGRHSLVEAD